MLWQKDERLDFELEDGIIIDYTNNRFVILIKDKLWTEHEINALYHNQLHIWFGYERICAYFLLENTDSIDTSDAVFDIRECDEKDHLLNQTQYDIEIYLLNHQNEVCASRCVTLSKTDSDIIRETLSKQLSAVYDAEGFDHALYKLQHTYEPFEMEHMALFKASFS